jgi:hypothetical protein
LKSAWRRGLAIAVVRPERFMTFIQVGDEWQMIRSRMFRLHYDVVQQLGACDWVWVVEPNPAGTGHHVHVWQRGDFIPQAKLAELADSKGMGAVSDIRRWKEGGEAYGFKGVGYGLKGTAAADAGAAFLAANGARLTHQSRAFFFGGARAAEAAGVAWLRGTDSTSWELVSVKELHDSRGVAPRPTTEATP